MMDFIKLVVSLDAPITRIKEKQSELSRINDWLQRRGQSALDLSKIPEVVALREKIAEDAIFIQGRVMEAAKQNKIPIGDATDPAGAMSSQTSADLQTREALQDTVRNLNAKFDEVLQLRRIGRHPLQDQRDAEQKAFRDEVEGILANVRKELDELYERSADAEEMITEATTVLSEELHERFSQRLVKTREFGQSRVALEKDARELFTQVEKDTKVQQEEFRALVDRLSMLEKEKQELLKEEQEYKEILAKSTEDLGIMKNGLTALVQNRGAVISQSALSGGAKNKPMEHASTIGAVADDIVQNIVEQQLKPLLGRALQTAREEYDSQSEETLQKVVTSLAPTRELQKCLEEWHQSITMPPPASVRPPLAR
ncbi:uncharacterized protein EI90DRAFT_1949735 [Cantharellus anzutake]|uniref:uncharacterized protein n=1 Tax=Cantharellus anzutake TaxID=1750568 RepID=UPI0019067EFA|nr:uncharacterized protein EI90DRAFT_1949735 [Cantharellus anzutake]KAF8326392.1 hypothetical protein EI90DRAFT_1949735 [Cantharellus anzutake]